MRKHEAKDYPACLARPKPKPQTNFDKIKAMTVDEFAAYMVKEIGVCPAKDKRCPKDVVSCTLCTIDWLQQEVD